MSINSNLPKSGRGPRFDRNLVDQREAEADRLDAVENIGQLYLANCPINVDTLINAAQTAARGVFTFVGTPAAYGNLVYCRIRVAGASAANTLKTALYRLTSGQNRSLIKIPGSDVTFSTASVTTITTALPRPALVQPGVQYVIGTLASDAVATFRLSEPSAAGTRLLSRRIQAGLTSLPDSVNISLTTKDATNSQPAVIYLSEEFNTVF